jgi:hypothetical protein
VSWRLYGARLETADFGGAPTIYQPFTLPRNTRVKAVRTWFIAYNPTFTEMGMQIWDDRAGAPSQLLYTFDKTYVPGDLLQTHDYGAKEIYFDFSNARWLRKGTLYHLVPTFSAPTFDAASHMAWVYGYPNPNTSVDVTLGPSKISTTPFYLAIIGDDK